MTKKAKNNTPTFKCVNEITPNGEYIISIRTNSKELNEAILQVVHRYMTIGEFPESK